MEEEKKVETSVEEVTTEVPATEEAPAEVPAAEEVPAEVPAAEDTPAESMDDYSAELEASLKRVEVGDVLTGTVVGVTEDSVLVDLKYYSQGVIAKADFTADTEHSLEELVHPGEEVTATVVRRDDGEGNIVLSCKDANEKQAWDRMEACLADGAALTVKVSGVVKAGVVTTVEGLRGFIPASKLAAGYVENLEEWVGREVAVRVVTVERDKKRLVLSGRELARERRDAEKRGRAASVTVGETMEGTVESIQTYGAFVRLENGVSGLLHISQVSDRRLKSLKGVLEEGQTVTVRIRSVENGKVGLTMRDPESEASAKSENRRAPENNDRPRRPRRESSDEPTEYKSGENAVTGLGALLANLKLDK